MNSIGYLSVWSNAPDEWIFRGTRGEILPVDEVALFASDGVVLAVDEPSHLILALLLQVPHQRPLLLDAHQLGLERRQILVRVRQPLDRWLEGVGEGVVAARYVFGSVALRAPGVVRGGGGAQRARSCFLLIRLLPRITENRHREPVCALAL